ncbi:MAG: DUF2007 domain-containing protein [Terricaulis sp.]|nr:DUF2007 domain-containing protein [Terricaulis sp.]
MADLVLLAAFSSRPEALIAQGLLRSHGIEAFSPDAHITMAEIDPTWMSGWRLLVDEDAVERALAILREAQAEAGDEA